MTLPIDGILNESSGTLVVELLSGFLVVDVGVGSLIDSVLELVVKGE